MECVRGALDDAASLSRLVQGADAVIHCGGIVAARRDNDFYKVNAEGTEALVSAAQRQGVRRLLYISSLAARHPELSAYAGSKRKGEEAMRSSVLPGWDIIRPPAIYGPGDMRILPLFKALRHGIGLLPAGREGRTSIIHVDDFAGAVGAWVKTDLASRKIYEIDDGMAGGYNWRDILAATALLLNVKPRYIVPPAALMSIGVFIEKIAAMRTDQPPFLTSGKVNELRHADWVCRNSADFTLATAWRPGIALKAGVAATLNWYRQQSLI